MDKPPAKPPKSGNTLFNMLSRRSTKVEPAAPNHPASTATASHPSGTAPIANGDLLPNYPHFTASTHHSSAHSSPNSNQFRQSNIRRHSSTQNLSTIIRDEPSPTVVVPLRKSPNRGVTKKSKTNRLSHQFTLCCSFHDDRICTPPVSVRYNSLATNGALLPGNSPATGDPETSSDQLRNGSTYSPNLSGSDCGDMGTGGTSSTSTNTTVVTVHQSPGSVRSTLTPPAVSRGLSSRSNNSSASASSGGGGGSVTGAVRKSSTQPNTPAKPPLGHTAATDPPAQRLPQQAHFAKAKPPVFNEFQPHSIAMSACRSRLRQKLLPPGGSLDLPSTTAAPATTAVNSQQHFSSPDIALSAQRLQAAEDAAGQQGEEDVEDEAGAENRSLSYDRAFAVKRPVSADSLAKQSLIAAQLFNLIPAEKARERNFMAGRLAVNSLFGPAELEKVLPTREVKIYVCTWNMNGQNPPKTMIDFVLPHSIEFVPDLVVVGTQESCSVRFEWEVSLQETLGPSHILLHSATLGTLHLAVFIRRDLIWFCSVPEDASMSVRPGTAFRTKGAVAISFSLFGTTMLFVTSHLTAHQQKVKERVQDVKRIIHSLDLPKNLNLRNKNKDVTQNFDNVFWCGDLNFRLGEPREKVLKWIECTKFPLPAHLPNGYLHTDQLKSVLSNGAAFKDFKEANITFPPTYKYDPGTQHFDTSSKQRAPAYTDRILFKTKSSLPMGIRRGSNLANLLGSSSSGNQLECLAYDSVPSIVTSDHKPVWALFRSPVRPGLDTVPLAAGLFNREVYLEGMKRRLNSTNADSSTVCAIQ